MKMFQLLHMPAIQCPCFTAVEEGGKNHGIVDLQYWFSTLLRSLPSAWLALPILVPNSLPREPSQEMVLPRYLKCATMVGAGGWVFGAGWWSTLVLLRLTVRPKSLEASKKRSIIRCRSVSVWATRAQSSAKRTT